MDSGLNGAGATAVEIVPAAASLVTAAGVEVTHAITPVTQAHRRPAE